MLNFSYGSNMSTRYVRDYCPSAKYVMRATLPNFEIQFRRFSTDLNGGISTIIEAPGQRVEGVIYDIPEKEILELDILEDLPLGLYRRDSFLVLGEDQQWHTADLYRVVKPEGPFAPSAKYIEMMITGATEHQLSPAYIDKLKNLRPTTYPNSS
ncbi:MAG: gamma-glutamylcyclotransferase family protein [Chloroflexota bacterium]